MAKDFEVSHFIREEEKRQQATLDLIPSENIVSREVLTALGSVLTNKYSEGYAGKRYYAGNAVVDDVERLAIERARKVFHLGPQWHVNVQPYSGSPANLAVYMALLVPGEKVMGMSLPFGGHLTHGWKVSATGKLYTPVQYTVGRDGLLDFGAIRRTARKEKPKMIIAGATAYSRIIDFKKFAAISREVGAYLMVDMAHIAGLVAGSAHPSPFPYADVVTTTTHKTLRGPRGAIIFANKNSRIAKKNNIDIASAIDKAVFPGLQGGPHDNQTAAIAVALGEAMRPEFKRYARQIVKNARALARELKRLGFDIISGGTDNHLMLVDVTKFGISGREAQDRLENIGIVVNRNTIPYDTRSPFDPSGIRIGTPAITSRGMKEREMKEIASIIFGAFGAAKPKGLARRVRALTRRFPIHR
ncbi:MAG: serine hydroxymethyltransferase [Candidatus Wildermuthbacteria bacterium RIFCSPLOWO2_01_FULL_48_35]|uniref:Serine hydroxymethyltransferase n=1 Tax=Candidatus Wildermuthbacteria bacterium RIFCSPLOWO2_01_FULL_48_35 TaxID=1802463 RepID=A0A1G2RSY8_9BACT|nr:MAG: serine hydroxymethyltransferase [Candidatus Wildermuthbacteria bacterium RIFCSPLOWO2_01_FULL_48_35]